MMIRSDSRCPTLRVRVLPVALALAGLGALLAAVACSSGPSAAIDLSDPPGVTAPVTPPETVWVANNGSNDVAVIDVERGQLVAAIPVGSVPHNVTVGRRYAYAPNSLDGTVTLIDLATYRETVTLPVGSAPHDVALTPDERMAFVTNMGEGSVTAIDLAGAAPVVQGTIEVGDGPAHASVGLGGGYLYVANSGSGTISVVKVASLEIVQTIEAGPGAHNVMLTPDGRTAFATLSTDGGVVKIDLRTGARSRMLATGTQPHNFALSAAGDRLYVANTGATTVTVIDVEGWSVEANLDVGRDAHAVLLDGLGGAFVSNRGAGSVSLLDLESGEVTAVLDVGVGPDGLAAGPPAPDGLPDFVRPGGSTSGEGGESDADHGHDH